MMGWMDGGKRGEEGKRVACQVVTFFGPLPNQPNERMTVKKVCEKHVDDALSAEGQKGMVW